MGYLRYYTNEEPKILNDLYSILMSYINFFIPLRKLVSMTGTGVKISKIYGESKTTYKKVLESKNINDRSHN